MEWLNFRHLYAFWAVCRFGGFRRASARVRVSQSTLSEQVALLEEYLEVDLIERSTRSFVVTDRGAALLGYAEEIFERSRAINTLFRDKASSALPDSLRIGVAGGLSRNFLYGLISDRLVDSTPLRMDLFDGSFEELEAMLRRFDLDVIFSLDRPRQGDLRALEYHRVQESPVCLAGVPACVDAMERGEPVELYLYRHVFEGPPVEQVVEQRYGGQVTVPVCTDDISLLRFLANGGRGVAVVPRIGLREDLRDQRVRSVDLGPGYRSDLYALFLTQALHRPLVETFLGLSAAGRAGSDVKPARPPR